ncbi:nicotinate-nucleotide adenylyltransferase [Chitinibacter bivalviorum]|uniref:Probable nicotinate-nucleotide adenylyltransferase n=1 Tax=Chitinibacter bivalviorum TaxID=2739434 RepID=A0A7H9BN97_9NEIS|nr:nicotinate-nucleotide adenylyltransferase [Chitinibacter bivalviorum]QLG89501.1 nicotinate-nucleotide adenylyltransferase [Chitinibacter bivalviorum]
MQKIGIFGGTFDPIHYGHIELARCMRDQLQLDEVRLIPTGLPPHREMPPVSPQQRFDWVKAAIVGETGLMADDREVRRNGYCYTIDTLIELQQDTPDALLVWLIGADSWLNLNRWHRWRELLDMGHLLIAARPDYAFEGLSPDLSEEFARRCVIANTDTLSRGKISLLSSPLMPVSSTLVREMLARGEDVSALTPVWRQLESSGLYRF